MKILKWIGVIFCIALIGCQWLTYQRRISFVPIEMKVWLVLYAQEKAWGFGPGGNETGLIMYALPNKTTEKIRVGGISYLSSFSSAKLGKPYGWQGKYDQWYVTPVKDSMKTPFREMGPECGFCIDVNPSIKAILKESISKPGNFYAYGRVGMIIVSPAYNKVFYLYEG